MYFKRLTTGEVIGEIITEDGKVVESRNFGVMSLEEFEKTRAAANMENPPTKTVDL
jgi:hypothetical protein